MNPRKVAVVGGTRIPFSRSMSAYMGVSNEDLMTAALQGLVAKFSLKGMTLGEVSLGAVMKHSKDWNLAREVTLSSGLSAHTPAYDVQQACGTSLETSILVANKIALGQIDAGIAGGTDTNSDLPIVFSQRFAHTMLKSFKARSALEKMKVFMSLRPKDLIPVAPGVVEPRTGLSMGQSCEKMAQQWKITREDQDQLALDSHLKAAKAYEEGFYDDLITPFHGLSKDNNVRGDSTQEKLAKLKPAFDRSERGTLTAGNSTPLTDGASCVLLASEKWAKERSLPIQAYLTFAQTAAVDFVGDEGLLMAPAYAVPKLLDQAGLKLQDFDFYEIHEAFAAQVLCTLKAWESAEFCREKLGRTEPLGQIDRSKLNVKGGSVALGHPFAATGTRIVASLSKLLAQKGSGRGLISICTAGGMGVTAILERP
ncbi:MAG: acetyl-CoA C-acetyltransferase [Pseudobdellovibrionaceae bacterium]|nr:acetyl-CoA C-acetyltransferase [Bdellovibrionales bacterium]USN48461.1 MAG: acetyl-CoA C-acetyltransferase [Pseudobdellovibrionaceae bacterium]